MSLLGAMTTAVTGISAQSAAFANISDNVANSQTVGFKSIGTSFDDYLTSSTAQVNESGGVVALPEYNNSLQGAITTSSDTTALAISGQGFFAVSQQTGSTNSASTGQQTPLFNPTQFYTRAGDFQTNSSGYLVNSTGYYLNGYAVNQATGQTSTTLAPIQISQAPYPPAATSDVSLSANLPATPASGTGTAASPIESQISVYDAQGNQQQLSLSWVQNSANNWTVTVTSPGDTAVPPASTSATLAFNADGTLASVTSGGTTSTASPATLSISPTYAPGTAQAISLNLGDIGQAGGLTQYAGTSFALNNTTQNGYAQGNFNSVTTNANGDVIVNYDNGKSATVAEVPVVTFNDPNALQRQDGQAFTTTQASGTAAAQAAGTNGAGTLVASSVENSNVDIASQFSQLIVAQQAYSANAKLVTTASELLQQTINMKQ